MFDGKATFQGNDTELERRIILKAYQFDAFSGFKDPEQLRKQFFEVVKGRDDTYSEWYTKIKIKS